jgi:hypothetical protein
LQYNKNNEAYNKGLLINNNVQKLNLKLNSFSAIIIYSTLLGPKNSLSA